MKELIKMFLIVTAISLLSQNLFSQSLRSLINDGVEKYNKDNFTDSEVDFKKGLELDNQNYEGYFNLGDALYKQGRYDDAIKSYQNSLQFSKNQNDISKVFHNIGNSLLKNEKLKESIESYKNALKYNPDDADTKYNLSYALNKMKQQQNQKNQDKNKDNKDKNKDQQKNQDQNKDQQKDQDKKDQQQQDKNQDQQQQDQQNQPQQQDKISKEEAERILNALKNNEADLQKELRKHEGKARRREKDW
jgi:tetratricopeptide (TPR) repeat protein